jgi:hypothetical protein
MVRKARNGNTTASAGYELRKLESLILQEQRTPKEKKGWHKLHLLIRKEVDAIAKAFLDQATRSENERQLERYVQCHQQRLIVLLDHLSQQLEDTSPPKEQQKFFETVYLQLESLLQLLHENFTSYINGQAKLPTRMATLFLAEIKNKEDGLKHLLLQKNISESLAAVLLNLLRKLEHGSISYRSVQYMQEFLSELVPLLKETEENTTTEEALHNLIYTFNLNATSMVTYFSQHVQSMLNTLLTTHQRIEKLSYYLKTVNQVSAKPGLQFNPFSPSLKDQLNQYVREEILYHEKVEAITCSISKTEVDAEATFKIMLQLSVSQVAYLFRLLVETRIIANQNLTQLLQFLSVHMTTKKSEALSYGSIRSKYYHVENGTKESVKEMLLGLIRHMDNH